MVRPTSAADISSRPVAASPAALMRDLDLLLRLSGRIVKGCRLPGSLALLAAATTIQAACRGMPIGPSSPGEIRKSGRGQSKSSGLSQDLLKKSPDPVAA